MARMLGRFRTGGCGCGVPGPDCSGHERDTRKRKRAEAREVEREVRQAGAYVIPAPFTGLSDCRHGCNGDCIVLGGGSEVCTFTCHPGLSPDPVRSARAAAIEAGSGLWPLSAPAP